MQILLGFYLVAVAVAFALDRMIFQQIQRATGQSSSPGRALLRSFILPIGILFFGVFMLITRLFGRHRAPGATNSPFTPQADKSTDERTIDLNPEDYKEVDRD